MPVCPQCNHVNPDDATSCARCLAELTVAPEHDGFTPGSRVGYGDRYVVVSMLGAGGMGSVWRATDTVCHGVSLA